MNVREALAGRSGASLRGLLWLALPVSLVAVVQEISVGDTDPARIAASAAAQLIAMTLWGALVAGVSRALTGRIVPLASGVLWIGVGVARGLAGGAVAAATGFEPDWLYRVVFWTVLTLLWAPLVTYTLAQLDERRRLLALRNAAQLRLADAERLATSTAEERRAAVAHAIDDALRPAIDEVRAALRDSGETIGPERVSTARTRIGQLARQAAAFDTAHPVASPAELPTAVSAVDAAREFELTRPVLTAVLTIVATSAFLLPEAMREGGWPHVGEMIVAVGASGAALSALLFALRPLRAGSIVHRLLSRFGMLLSGVLGAVVLVALPWEPFEPRDILVYVVFPFYFALSAVFLSGAVGLARANSGLHRVVDATDAATTDLLATIEREDRAVQAEIVELVTGELNGRLAACALALGVLANDPLDTAARDSLVAGVLDHLAAATADLDRLLATP